MAPHAGIEVGLELDAHAHAVGIGLAHAGHLAVGFVQSAQHVLDMMAHFMRDDIGVGEVAVGPQLLPHAGEKAQVDIQFFVGAAIEGAHGRLSLPASRRGAAGVQDQRGRLVATQAGLLEILRPHVLGGSQDLPGELGQGLVLGRGLVAAFRGETAHAAGVLDVLEDIPQIAAHQERNEGYNGDAADSQPGLTAATQAPAVFHMRAFASSVQFHSVL